MARASRSKTPRTIEKQIDRLRIYNVVAGSLHLLQAIGFAVVLTMLSTQVLFNVTADYLGGPPGFPAPAERVVLFEVNLGIGGHGHQELESVLRRLDVCDRRLVGCIRRDTGGQQQHQRRQERGRRPRAWHQIRSVANSIGSTATLE